MSDSPFNRKFLCAGTHGVYLTLSESDEQKALSVASLGDSGHIEFNKSKSNELKLLAAVFHFLSFGNEAIAQDEPSERIPSDVLYKLAPTVALLLATCEFLNPSLKITGEGILKAVVELEIEDPSKI